MISCCREAIPSPCFLKKKDCLPHLPSQVGRIKTGGGVGGRGVGGGTERIALGKMVLSVVMVTVARCHQEPALDVDLPSKKAGF